MKIEYLKVAGQAHPCVAEVYHKSEAMEFGESNPFKTSNLGSTCGSCMIVRPTIHEIMALDYDRCMPEMISGVRSYAAELRGNFGKWNGGSHEDMIKRRTGWPEGVKKMLDAIKQVVPEAEFSQRPRPHWAVDGYDLDLDRFRDGHERAFLSREMRRGSRNISLTVQYGENCGTDPDHLFWRGAAAVAAIDTLEHMGYRVDLTAVCTNANPWHSKNNNELLAMLVNVKAANEPVDLDYLASTLASPLFFRGNVFCWWFSACQEGAMQYGLGRMIDNPLCFGGDVHINTLPKSPAEAKKLYDEIVETAHKKMSRKLLTHGLDTV